MLSHHPSCRAAAASTVAGVRASRAWGALDIATRLGISVRLHGTDHPYKWHVNDREEGFAVLDGTVDMHQREAEQAHRVQTARW